MTSQLWVMAGTLPIMTTTNVLPVRAVGQRSHRMGLVDWPAD